MKSLRIAFPVLLLSSWTLAPLTAQEPAAEAAAEYEIIATIQGGEVARETIRYSEAGWRSEGSFDLFGQRSGSYVIDVQRTEEGGFRWTLESGDGTGYEANLSGRSLTSKVKDSDEERTKEVGEGEAFVYEDLIWGAYFDLGRHLARLDREGELEEGHVFQALLGSIGRGLDVTLVSKREFPQIVEGFVIPLTVYTINFAGAVEMALVCDPVGLPVLLEVPSQFVRAWIDGFESVRSSEKEPTSIIDAGAWREQLSQPDLDYEVQRNVRVPMRDGVELATDVFLPEGEGPFPTVLARTPYNRATESGLKGAYYARRGYAFVAQDVRGRFESDGEFTPLAQETDDGSDTIDWIAEQPWSDGQVGMVGASYVGVVQWLAAKSGNEHLVCIVPQVSPPDPHENFPYEGGAFIYGAVWWARVLESMDLGEELNAGVDWEEAFVTLPATEIDTVLEAESQTWLDEWLTHPPHDLEFWGPAGYQRNFESMTVPSMHITGWWDGDQPGALQNYVGMSERAKTQEARDAQYLIVGPWTHFFNTARAIGEVDYGDEAIVDLDSRIVRFFDRYLKGIENGIEDEPHVMTFTMGLNQWVGQSEWPPVGTEFVELYLSSETDARSFEAPGAMTPAHPTGGRESVTYEADPNAVPEFELDFEDLSGAEATADQSDAEDREDDLEFLSPPMKTDVDLIGPIEVDLYVSTDAADTDFVATLFRVTPEGEHFALRSGLQRLRYAKNPLEDNPVPPGTIAKCTIDCWATGERLPAGDRLFLRITSQAWPGVIRSFNTLENPAFVTEGVIANNTIHFGPKTPSCLRLPVVPSEAAPGLSFEER
ncbi:MAG: CocE/NonD family hydrolase [Planctomycetota bacterium]